MERDYSRPSRIAGGIRRVKNGRLPHVELLLDEHFQLLNFVVVEAFAAPNDAAIFIDQHERRKLVDGELSLDRARVDIAAQKQLIVDTEVFADILDFAYLFRQRSIL